MVSAADIIRFTDAVVARFRPERIILFGSYAYGEPTADSDVNACIVCANAAVRGIGHPVKRQNLKTVV